MFKLILNNKGELMVKVHIIKHRSEDARKKTLSTMALTLLQKT